MITKQNQQILIGGAVIFRDNRGKRQWFLVKQKDGDNWEIPKVTVRKGESSVRSVLRLTGEQAGMSTRILEEVGRLSGNTTINNKLIAQKYYYYLMLLKAGGLDPIGFHDFCWVEYTQAIKKVELKKEKDIFKNAKEVLKEWEKTHNLKKQESEMI